MGRSGFLMALFVAQIVWAGCKEPNPAVCCTTTDDCAAHGLSEMRSCAQGLVCVKNECEAPESCQTESDCEAPTPLCAADGVCAECLDSSRCGDQICDEAMHQCRDCTSDDECATGFCSPATNRCAPGTITPRYLPDICESPATTALNITSSSDPIDCSTVLPQGNGAADICVVRHTSITLAPSIEVKLTGGLYAMALVADGDIVIAGVLDVSADGARNGPGVTTESGGPPNPNTGGGGGGAGFKTPGGAGSTNNAGGAANGGPLRDGTDAVTLLGGASSGAGRIQGTQGVGGGGGGALTIISCRGHISITGVIDASGGGGFGGQRVSPNMFAHGGWGGGSGGNVVLQGRKVSVTGQMFANGGGGGGGMPDTSNSAVGGTGSDGLRTVMCAIGGTAPRSAAGGTGGCTSDAAKDGRPWQLLQGSTVQPSAGGGGGSVGYLQVFTPEGATPTLTPSAVSPPFEAPGTLETH